jgi:hypothetical protein
MWTSLRMNNETGSRVRQAHVLAVLHGRPEWPTAVARLRELYAQGGAAARVEAARYGQRYAGERGAMVVDVVASRQRAYLSKVDRIVNRWREEAREPTLAWLAAHPPDRARLELMASEPETMRQVAENLVAFGRNRGLDEDEGCRTWAEEVDGLEHAHRLDPVVGGVSGIGPALFALMRMRCGGNAIKPDLRVRRELRRLGFEVPASEHAILVVAKAAATELGVDLLLLDQFLWWAEEHRKSEA